MAKFEVKNSEGTKVAEAELAAEVYGIEPNLHVMHHIVTCQHGLLGVRAPSPPRPAPRSPAAARSLGARRVPAVPARVPPVPPQWRHGGVVFAPKPRSYAKRMNNKEVKLAMRSALSAKLRRRRARARRRLRLREAVHQGRRRHAQGSRP